MKTPSRKEALERYDNALAVLVGLNQIEQALTNCKTELRMSEDTLERSVYENLDDFIFDTEHDLKARLKLVFDLVQTCRDELSR